ncbi:exodeoxyribonuclease VII small subunit [Desulfovibrio desulfuricans]|uniref:exodeoxyribonuclease VII small subunit n=1 Tax=Desulfovibrio desulfuricans TaxID=876 RepID=UPI0035B36EB6
MSAKTDNTFEKKMARLQEIVAALENGDLPLEKGMALYKEGAACSRYCREQLEKARHELEIWQDGQAQPLQTRAAADGGLNAEEEAE